MTPALGATPLEVAWNGSACFDLDGASAAGVTANHTHKAPGTYTARLTVTDNYASVSLKRNTKDRYRVSADNASGGSAYSNIAEAKAVG